MATAPKHFVFVMDPIKTVIEDEDTSFALMLEAQHRGHRVDHCLIQDVHYDKGVCRAVVRRATMERGRGNPVTLAGPETIDVTDADVVFIRKDPPFNAPYRWLSLLLQSTEQKTVVVNAPRGLREANEKLYALNFPDVTPPTLVSADKARIRAFVDEVGGHAVIKPIDGHGGAGIFALRTGDSNVNAAIESVTHEGRQLAMVQRFIPEVSEGDKRILLVDGEPLGAILRVPQGGDLRSNIHVGGSVVAAEITETDQRIIDTVAEKLREHGLFFVGLDVIGPYLTEVNVTSPTGIQQMSRLSGDNLEAKVIDSLERKVDALSG